MTNEEIAEELHAAARLVRGTGGAAEARRPAPWSTGAAGTVISPREGGYDYVSGYTISEGPEVAQHIALMDPSVSAALADWLESTAVYAGVVGDAPRVVQDALALVSKLRPVTAVAEDTSVHTS